jgi:sulfate permease, SulP family
VWHALPALGFAAVLWVVLRRLAWSGAMVAILVAGVIGFHLALWLLGVPLAAAQSAGWVPRATEGAVTIPNMAALVVTADWGVVMSALPAIVTVAFLTLIGALMNTSALEAVVGQDTDTNREMKVTGLANLVIAAFAGPPAYSGFASSLMAVRAGIVRRGTGLVMAAVALVGLVAAGPLIAAIPVFLMTGLIIYLGLDLLNDWLIRTRHTYSRAEWAVVAAILAIVILLGFFQGIVAGLLIACVIFVWNYASVPILRRTGSLRDFSSTLSRGPAEAAWLRAEGVRVEVVELQGFLFFGTADRLRDHVSRRIASAGPSPLMHLIFDFAHVVGLDAAAAAQMERIAALAEQNGMTLALSGCRSDLTATLDRAAPTLLSTGAARLVQTLDEALEQAEDAVLSLAPQAQLPTVTMLQRLAPDAEDLPHLERLLSDLPPEHLPRGSVVMRAGEVPDSLVFLEQGRVVVRAPSTGTDGPRLRAMAAGAVLGDIGLALKVRRTADVLADTDVVLRRLTTEHMTRIEAQDAPLYRALLRLQCRALAEKIVFDERVERLVHRK